MPVPHKRGGPDKAARAAGLAGIRELVVISGFGRRTLEGWHNPESPYHDPQKWATVLAGAAALKQQHHRAKVPFHVIEKVRAEYRAGLSVPKLAQRYQESQDTIGGWVYYRTRVNS